MTLPRTPTTAAVLASAHDTLIALLGEAPGVADLLAAAERATDPVERVMSAVRGLEERAAAYQDGIDLLTSVAGSLAQVVGALPFTEEGWPQARARLDREMSADPRSAARGWFAFWTTAVGQCRFDALERLHRDVPLPAALAVLEQRAVAAERGLAARRWASVAPVLRQALPEAAPAVAWPIAADAALELRLLLVRVALACSRFAEAGELLTVDAGPRRAAGLALSARRRRLAADADADPADAGASDAGREEYESARDLDPRDLDVANETIARTRTPSESSVAVLDVARAAVDAVGNAYDLERRLASLVEPAAELWLAVSDRLVREGMPDAAGTALDRAAAVAPADDRAILALIREFRARMIDGSGGLDEWIEAAKLREANNQFAEARADYAPVLDVPVSSVPVDGTWAVARVSWARCVLAMAFTLPVDSIRHDLLEAVAVCRATEPRLEAPSYRAWALSIVAALHERLTQTVAPDRDQNRWAALLAAERSAALQPRDAAGWVAVADAARNLALFSFALFAARIANDLDPDDVANRLQYIAHVINAGHCDEGLTLLDELLARPGLDRDSTRFAVAMRGYAHAKAGRPSEALAALTSGDMDPLASWIWETAATALASIGRWDDALGIARSISTQLHALDEAFLAARADYSVAMVSGRFAEAVQHARAAMALTSEGEVESRVELLTAQTLIGDLDACRELCELVAAGRNGGTVRTFKDFEFVYMVALAKRWGTTDGDRWQAMITALPEPDTGSDVPAAALHELMRLAAATPISEARPASALGAVLIRLPGADPAAIDDVIAGNEAYLAAFGPEVAQVRASMSDWSDAGEPVAEQQPSPIADVASPAETPAQVEDEDERPVLELPPSWFAGHDDPLATHPMFVRWLPEARERNFPIAALRITTSEDLEPDGYRLLPPTGELVSLGRMSEALRYLPSPDTPVTGADGAAVEVMKYGDDPVVRDVGLAGVDRELLTWSAAEALLHEVAASWVAHASAVPAPAE